MTIIKKILPLLTFCITNLFSAAQTAQKASPENYRMVNWNFEQGFPHKKTYSIIKDIKGFSWIGTETGLSRFDGSTFKNYFPDDNKPGAIPYGIIKSLKEDSLHNIWIGSDKGLWRYDNSADTFTHFFAYDVSDYINTYIIPFWATKEELLCLEADTMITAYNVHSLTKRRIVYLSKKVGNNDPIQFSVYEPGTESVWLLQGLTGLFHVSLRNGRMESHGSAGSEGMCYDRKRNAIWLNSPTGLTLFDLYNKKFKHISEVDKIFERGVGINIDTYGRIWVGTSNNLFIYDPDSHSVTVPFPKDPDTENNIYWANYRIYCDLDGFVWIGYWTMFGKGITQLIPNNPTAKRYLNHTGKPNSLELDWGTISIKAIDGKIWIGGDNRLNIFDPTTGLFRKIEAKELKGINRNGYVTFLGVDSTAQKAWLEISLSHQPSRLHELYEMNISTLHCTSLPAKDLNDRAIFNLGIHNFETRTFRNGLLFTAGDGHHKVFMLHKDSNMCRQVLDLGSEKITNLATDEEETLFLRIDGSPVNKTYSLINKKWVQIHTPLDSIPWIEIRYNKTDKTWWAGAFMQIIHYDKNFRLIRRYTDKEGIPDILVHSIMPDNSGNIWFNGSSGYISHLNLRTGFITTLSDKDGFQKQSYFNLPNVIKDDNGDIYFTGYAGIDRIRPEKYFFVSATVHLKSLEIKNYSLPDTTVVNNLRQLSLKYYQNKIHVETGTIDYYSKGKSQIRYKLEGEGRNENWQYAPANYTIRYEELPPGNYRLQMQAGNAGNEFNGPVKTISFLISPAFWNTWWFRVIAIVFIFSVFYSLIRYRAYLKFRRRLEKSEQEKQVAELERQKSEMEMQALRAQMNPHFIFNSLNSINRFILQNNRAQASEYLTKFSKLVRLILQNSQATLISLESELDALNLYLDLESLRFDNRFGYKISVPKDLDIEVLKVPPLIVQPYTENAIWHGLMHKEDKGQLDIEVSQENNYLYFKITDNGIGRKQAAAMASKSATKHKSMGLKITEDRIAILQKSNGAGSPVKIIDLENPDGSTAGTEVIIKMPLIYD